MSTILRTLKQVTEVRETLQLYIHIILYTCQDVCIYRLPSTPYHNLSLSLSLSLTDLHVESARELDPDNEM